MRSLPADQVSTGRAIYGGGVQGARCRLVGLQSKSGPFPTERRIGGVAGARRGGFVPGSASRYATTARHLFADLIICIAAARCIPWSHRFAAGWIRDLGNAIAATRQGCGKAAA